MLSQSPSQIPFHVFPDPRAACVALAGEIAALIRTRAADGKAFVLGLATGSTPLPLYEALIHLHRDEGLSFANVIAFNLDEYIGLPPEDPKSYRSFMDRVFFSLVDVPPDSRHIPRGDVAEEELEEECRAYEQKIRDAGGIDFQILGIGRTGHIGFNEPGSSIASRTRVVHLDPVTRSDAAKGFGGLDHVPERAITMGCGTILEARRIALLAWGRGKADVVAQAAKGPVTDTLPASYLRMHPQCAFHLDAEAAAAL